MRPPLMLGAGLCAANPLLCCVWSGADETMCLARKNQAVKIRVVAAIAFTFLVSAQQGRAVMHAFIARQHPQVYDTIIA